MADFKAIGDQFVAYYYETFDKNRADLAGLYRNESMLTFEQQPTMGTAAIVEKLQNLPFQQIQHRTDTIDCQPIPGPDMIIVLVTGALLVEGQDKPMSFTQTFSLKSEGGSWFILNDVFRLVYPAA